MERHEKNVDIFNAIRRLRKNGIFVTCDHILGTPGESFKDQDDALLFYTDAGPNVVKPLPLAYLPKTRMTKIAIERGIITEQDEDDAAHGFMNSLMFKGHGYETEWRPYFMMYGLRPILPKAFFLWMVQSGNHMKLGNIPNVAGLDAAVFFAPRIFQGVTKGYDRRAKYLGWRFAEMLQYSMARKARAMAMGPEKAARKMRGKATPVSRVTARILRRGAATT
jgi:radical SAM superfamily enzyme YgiQ (UPF0313 family)